MNEELLAHYAAVCTEINRLQEEKESLNPHVVEHMQELKVDKIQTAVGTFSFQNRRTYKFTDEVAIAEEEVEAIKQEEIRSGVAVAVDKTSLRFQELKQK